MRVFSFLLSVMLFTSFSSSHEAAAAGTDPDRGQEMTRTLRAITYNVWGLPRPILPHPSRFADIQRLIPTLGADFIAFQEVFDRKAQVLEKLPQYPYRVYGPSGKGLKTSAGLLFASRWPILDARRRRYSICKGTDCMARKGMLFVRVRIPGIGEVDLFNTHLNAAGSEEIRLAQLEELHAFIQEFAGDNPLLMLGDFNFHPETRAYSRFLDWTSARDAHSVHVEMNPDLTPVEKEGFTSDPRRNPHLSENAPSQRIDYIFYRAALDQEMELSKARLVFDAPVQGRHLSDHFGVLADFEVELSDAENTNAGSTGAGIVAMLTDWFEFPRQEWLAAFQPPSEVPASGEE